MAFITTSAQVFAADLAVKSTPAPVEYGNIYFGVDVDSHGGLAGYAGVLYAPLGMHQSGVRLSVFGILGKYTYDDGEVTTFDGRFAAVDFLVGWSHVVDNGAITLAVGANYQDQRVEPFDPFNSVQGSKLGFKIQGDFWTNPTERTLIVGLASYTTAFESYYSILRAGYDFFDRGFFIGPEAGMLGNDRTDQLRLGAHISNIRVGPAKLTISGGWLYERDEGEGAYGTASLDFSF